MAQGPECPQQYKEQNSSVWLVWHSPLPLTFGYVEISRLTFCVCVDRACDPTLYEPNLGINLEVSDLINNKKGNL